MSLGDKLGAAASRLRSLLFPTVSDHPANGGMTGDLDPDDWPDAAEATEESNEESPAE